MAWDCEEALGVQTKDATGVDFERLPFFSTARSKKCSLHVTAYVRLGPAEEHNPMKLIQGLAAMVSRLSRLWNPSSPLLLTTSLI